MNANVELIVNELDDVLSVPVSAVVTYDGKDHVAVKKPDGGFEWREVTLGAASDKVVEVRHGIKSGERVALFPLNLLSEEEKRAKHLAPDELTAPVQPQPPTQPRLLKKGTGKARARP
jgi:multidrug efflux pump subunit AcrA (membrane-fusion protein)